jgi:hypothetical protein
MKGDVHEQGEVSWGGCAFPSGIPFESLTMVAVESCSHSNESDLAVGEHELHWELNRRSVAMFKSNVTWAQTYILPLSGASRRPLERQTGRAQRRS